MCFHGFTRRQARKVIHKLVDLEYAKIEIGEGLRAVALSHHPACGTIPGGSCSRYIQFVLIEEEKQALLGKETVR